MKIIRQIQSRIETQLFKNKVILLYGARRVGKTTLVNQIMEKYPDSRFLNCELLQNQSVLQTTNSERLLRFLGKYKLIILDEAQHIQNIGLILKILHDIKPGMQIIATGSSSFELDSHVSEPLTGSSRVFALFPFSFGELTEHSDIINMNAHLENFLRFGLYPEVFFLHEEDAIEEISHIASDYLYKDILQFERIKHPDLLVNLLRALALQIGNEVSLNELSRRLKVSVHTVQRYIELLEKTFVIFRLNPFSRNMRSEIGKSQKIYFYDLGIRNSLLQNFNPLELRSDIGALWENFCISERIKLCSNTGRKVNHYFWRTYDQKEIDLVEESGGILSGFEFKWNDRKIKQPKEFLTAYPNSTFQVINKENFFDFVA